MNKNELRIKCAEVIGWKEYAWEKPSAHGHLVAIQPDGLDGMMPNYPNDLNACAELRASLTQDEQFRYANALNLMLDPEAKCGPAMMTWRVANASPEVHCNAYLAAKGLL